MEDTRQSLLKARTQPSPDVMEGNDRTPLDDLEVRAHSTPPRALCGSEISCADGYTNTFNVKK